MSDNCEAAVEMHVFQVSLIFPVPFLCPPLLHTPITVPM